MGRKTGLPSLEDALDRLKNQASGSGLSGLSGGMEFPTPEIENPHLVSSTHPFTPERDSEDVFLGKKKPKAKRKAPKGGKHSSGKRRG